ncbi:MAG: acyl-CoA dehydrogenase family protein [Alphaproteobacteria bacterium]|nr:acyl-CoA dehydrogenase family protein [Alphaproteobacteria bacterium]
MTDLRRDPADDQFRQEVRAFLAASLPPEMARRNRQGYHGPKEDTREWTRILHAKGWSAPNWPVEHGGTGWTLSQQAIFDEECTAAGAPMLDIFGLSMVGPLIYTFGTDDLKSRILPAFLRGEITWAQGFSEPNSGSDLGSLQTRAVIDGGDYVINGRKIWTSAAHYADLIFFLVRTGEGTRNGLSMLIVDAKSPGLAIRPIIDIRKEHSLNEVILDDVRTPVANRIGEEGKGWGYAKALLENERAFAAEIPRNRNHLATLRRIAAETIRAGRPLIEDPLFSAQIAELEVEFLALEFMTLRAMSQTGGGPSFGSLLKVRGSELVQRITQLQVEALGDCGAYLYSAEAHIAGEPQPAPGPDFAPGIWSEAMYRRASSIYGGANEIQRTLIAKQYLEL